MQSLTVHRPVSIADLLAPGGMGLQGPLPTLTLSGPATWKLDIQVGGTIPVKFNNAFGTVTPALELTGSPAHPKLAGRIDLGAFTITDNSGQLTISSGSLFLNATAPSLFLTASGNLAGKDVDGTVSGTLVDKHTVSYTHLDVYKRQP